MSIRRNARALWLGLSLLTAVLLTGCGEEKRKSEQPTTQPPPNAGPAVSGGLKERPAPASPAAGAAGAKGKVGASATAD